MENMENVVEMVDEAVNEVAPKGKAGMVIGILAGAATVVGAVIMGVKKYKAKHEDDVIEAEYEEDDVDDSEDVD